MKEFLVYGIMFVVAVILLMVLESARLQTPPDPDGCNGLAFRIGNRCRSGKYSYPARPTWTPVE